jgi:hypothetical protein
MAPPVAESYTCEPRIRSEATASSAAARIGNTISTSSEVIMMFHVKIGSRNIVMPGARSVRIVVIMFTPPRMVPRPEMTSPTIHMSAPTPGELITLASGW